MLMTDIFIVYSCELDGGKRTIATQTHLLTEVPDPALISPGFIPVALLVSLFYSASFYVSMFGEPIRIMFTSTWIYDIRLFDVNIMF